MKKFTCPHCRRPVDLQALSDDADWRAFVELARTLPACVGKVFDEYLQLFRPVLRDLSPARMRRLTEELAPAIRAARVQHNGTEYVVPAELWAREMQALIDKPPATLRLPLKSHGYLLAVLAAKAEQAAARAETQRERARQQRSGDRGGPRTLAGLLERAQARGEGGE